MWLTIIYILSGISALMYAVFYVNKSFEIHLLFFAAYLIFMFSFEVLVQFLPRIENSNLLVYHLLIFFEFNCLLLFFKNILELKVSKNIVLRLIVIFNAVYFISNLYYYIIGATFLKYNSIAALSGGILVTVCIFLFYKEFLGSNKILNYKKSLSFWIAFGLLFYYLGSIPFTSIINSIGQIPQESKYYLIKIQYFLSIFMHSCFIFGALWSQKQVK